MEINIINSTTTLEYKLTVVITLKMVFVGLLKNYKIN